jgi:hypothetical protein
VKWSRENGAYIYEMFSNVVLYGGVGATRVCIVGANSGMCVVLGENRAFQIFFDPLVDC